jgi:hypothetical protein
MRVGAMIRTTQKERRKDMGMRNGVRGRRGKGGSATMA